MGQRIVIQRYAEAFVDYATNTIGMEKALDEIGSLKEIMRDNTELYQILSSPSLSLGEKFGFIDEIFKDRFSQELSQFLKLVVEKRRAQLFFDMLDYIKTHYSHGEALAATFKSAYPLDLEVMEGIKEKLEKKLQRKLHVYMELDKKLLAGVQVTVGNTTIDGSVKRRLDELREKIKAARMD